jgi:hypothetical protein
MHRKWKIVNVLSYDLPHHIYDTHVYPRKSSNGSTVIVYGNETGLRVVWYAGRRFKAPSAKPKVNGHGTKDAMVIDSDSDDDQPATPNKADFDDELDEVDPANAYHGVLRHLEVPLGSAALTLAVPHIPKEGAEGIPSILQDNIVLAAACADYCIRLIRLPLDPPIEAIVDSSSVGVQIVKVPLLNYHQDLVSSVAVTATTAGSDDSDEAQEDDNADKPNWSFLVASTSATGAGLLLVHRVVVEAKILGNALLLRRVALRSPMMAARICFNTASPPAVRHSELLITIPDAPCVKVYQVFPPRSRQRRGSNATTGSGSTSRSLSISTSAGKFIVTLLPEYQLTGSNGQVQRRRVLDSKWIFNGRAVLALLEDGEWGIWDLDAAGPAGSNTVIRGQNNVTGIVGGGITKFAARGSRLNKTKASKANAPDVVTEAPQPSTGFICINQSPSQRNDESAILSCNGEAQFIASVSTYWKSRVSGKGALQPFDRATILPSLRTGGETPKNIAMLPEFPNESRRAFELQTQPNFLVSTDTRLILHVNPLSEPVEALQDDELALRGASGQQSLLENGDLDLEGVDRYLDDMSRSRPVSRLAAGPQQPRSEPRARPNFGSSMISHDGDVDMDADEPTPVGSSQSLVPPKSSSKTASRRLFS